MKIKASDYIIQLLIEENIEHVFGLTGGAVVHLFDSIDKNKNINAVFHHHEQAASFAAESYAKYKNDYGVAFFTTGPGGTNGITGLAAAWLDSIPAVYISGQARLDQTTVGKNIRQLGTQQLDIIPIVEPLTKYAIMIDNIKMIKYHIKKALHIAKEGRPGPVWIDIPLDFQWTEIEIEEQINFIPKEINVTKESSQSEDIKICIEKIKKAKRPLFLLGYGARLSNKDNQIIEFLKEQKIPFVTTWNVCDLIETDNVLNLGIPGVAGQRGANLAVHNCDLLVAIGSHLPIPVTSGNYNSFAPNAYKIVIDVDKEELAQETVKIDLKINEDIKIFINYFDNQVTAIDDQWAEYCSKYKMLNDEKDAYKYSEGINQYLFVKKLSQLTREDTNYVIDGGGTNVYISYQGLNLKKDQRVILSNGLCSMGSGLPEAIGACYASNFKETICLCGDGSFQLNIQELQTIIDHKLPIKIFVYNNSGYLSIRQTQKSFLDSNFCGSAKEGGMNLPDYKNIAKAYNFKTFQISSHDILEKELNTILQTEGPTFCEIMVCKEQDVIPRQGFLLNKDGTFTPEPLYNMYPFLDESILQNLMIKN